VICYTGANLTIKEQTAMKVYTIEEAAEVLRLRPSTVKRWLQEGRLKGTKLSQKVWRITEDQLQASMVTADVSRRKAEASTK